MISPYGQYDVRRRSALRPTPVILSGLENADTFKGLILVVDGGLVEVALEDGVMFLL
jgi:hypothetical protein